MLDERLGIAIPQRDRDFYAHLHQARSERCDEGTVLGVDRADAAQGEVVLPHLRKPGGRDSATGRDAFQERQDLLRTLGPTEGHNQDGVETGIEACMYWFNKDIGHRLDSFTVHNFGLGGCPDLWTSDSMPGMRVSVARVSRR
jgi:hypothetical protein